MRTSNLDHAKRPVLRGFTLIEMIIVVFIVGVLLALLLPAIQMTRESARRAQCLNHFRQLGLALHNYMAVHEVFPAGQGGRGQSLHVASLPYLEFAAIYHAFNFDRGVADGEVNRTCLNVQVTEFLCPSDPVAWRQVSCTSYAGNLGDGCYIARNTGVFTAASDDTHYPANIASKEIVDGMAMTVAMSEWLIGAVDFPEPSRHFFTASTPGRPTNPDQFVADCRAASTQGPIGWSNLKGSEWATGNWRRNLYDHAIPPNGPSCANGVSIDPFQGLAGGCSAGSLHPGGVNVLMADGHAQFVRGNIAPATWRALATRQGGEVLSDDRF